MLIAFDTVRETVVTGPETRSFRQQKVSGPQHVLTDGGVGARHPSPPQFKLKHSLRRNAPGSAFSSDVETRYECVVCGEPVVRNDVQSQAADPVEIVFDWFKHTNSDTDCFGDSSMSDSHRTAVELSAHRLARASQCLQGGRYSCNQISLPRIESEKRVTATSNGQWIDTDVHLSAPRVAVEVFCKINQLDLRRRLSVLFNAGYDAYLVFDVNGRYDPSEIEMWLQRIAAVPVRVGRFDPSCPEPGNPVSLSLGTRLSASVIDPSALAGPNVPVFLQ